MLLSRGAGSNHPWRRLRYFDPVNIRDDVCLPARRPGMDCGVCADACPTGVITAAEKGISLSVDGCLGCGRCATACPTGAIAVDGFEATTPARDSIAFECRRVAESASAPGAERLPCLGGITGNRLLSLCAEGAQLVTLVDRGWCADCPAGGEASPWSHAVEDACATLDRIRDGMAARIRVERRPLPAGEMRPLEPERSGPRIARRAFLGRLAGAAPAENAEGRRQALAAVHTLPNVSRGLVAPIARQERLTAVSALAAAAAVDVPATLFPSLSVADSCRLHGVCAAICPTGALTLAHEAEAASLTFDAAACITCGECERVCPEHAMSLARDGDGRAAAGRIELMRRVLRACSECGSVFAASGSEESCSACGKDRNLMQTVFALVERRRAAGVDAERSDTCAGGEGPSAHGYGG